MPFIINNMNIIINCCKKKTFKLLQFKLNEKITLRLLNFTEFLFFFIV